MNIQPNYAAAHPKRRALAASAAALLMAGGFYAYAAQNAQPAHASTQVTGGLDVSINPGSTTVGLGTITTTITYTCTDTSAPNGKAALRVEFDQNDNDVTAEQAVACGSSDVGKTQNVTAVQIGMSGSQEVTVTAALDDQDTAVTATANTVDWQASFRIDPTLTFPGDGSVTVTGSYNCASDVSGVVEVISAGEDNSSTNIAAGEAVVPLSTCNGTNQTFSANITSANPGGSFAIDDPDILVTAVTPAHVIGAGTVSPDCQIKLFG